MFPADTDHHSFCSEDLNHHCRVWPWANLFAQLPLGFPFLWRQPGPPALDRLVTMYDPATRMLFWYKVGFQGHFFSLTIKLRICPPPSISFPCFFAPDTPSWLFLWFFSFCNKFQIITFWFTCSEISNEKAHKSERIYISCYLITRSGGCYNRPFFTIGSTGEAVCCLTMIHLRAYFVARRRRPGA